MSGNFFLAGFVISKLKNIPLIILASALNFISLTAYLIGYLSWFLATLFYPEHQPKENAWYGFAQLKSQYQLSAILGTLATILCLLIPSFILPIAWIYTGSNVIWGISEYHKKNNPPPKEALYSTLRQKTYLCYVLLVTGVSALTAITYTVSVLQPQAAYLTLLISSIVSNILTLASLYYWKKAVFDKFEPDTFCDLHITNSSELTKLPNQLTQTYSKISEQLSGDENQLASLNVTDEKPSIPISPTPPSTHVSSHTVEREKAASNQCSLRPCL